MSAELDLTPLEEGNLTEDQRRLFAEVRLRLEAIEKENAAMKAHRRVGLVWETDSYKARFSDPVWGTDWERGGIVLDHDPAVSRPDGDTGNLIIEGDNIDALRVLSRTHKGKFDCIFIDPPYNTESTTFVYNDKQIDKEDRLRYSVWIEGLHRRLRYVPDLLSDQGVLLVAINDDNRSYVEMLVSQNILPGKFMGTAIWKSRSSTASDDSANLSVDHEHVLVFANPGFAFGGGEVDRSNYKFDDEDGKGKYTRDNITFGFSAAQRPNQYYPIQNPVSGLWYPCSPYSVWRFASVHRLKAGKKTRKDPMETLIANNKIYFPEEKQEPFFWPDRASLDAAIVRGDVPRNGKGVPLLTARLPDAELEFWIGKRVARSRPAFKRHLTDLTRDRKPLSSLMIARAGEDDVETIASGGTQEGDNHIKSMFHDKAFDYSKPVSLVQGLLERATGPNSLVLDFFGGSGTTAEAVLRLNAEDGGSRRFVMVSNTERSEKHPDRNLCRDVLARRVGFVIDGFTKGKKEIEGTGGGFAYLRTARVDYDGVAAWHAHEMTPERVWTLICLLEGEAVTPLTLTDGFAMLRTEDRLTAFVPEWGAVNASALATAFGEAPDAAHALFTDNDAAALRGLADLGVSSVVAEDAWERAEAVCGPDL